MAARKKRARRKPPELTFRVGDERYEGDLAGIVSQYEAARGRPGRIRRGIDPKRRNAP